MPTLLIRQAKVESEEFADHYHYLDAIFGPICYRCYTLEVPKVLIFMFCSSPY